MRILLSLLFILLLSVDISKFQLLDEGLCFLCEQQGQDVDMQKSYQIELDSVLRSANWKVISFLKDDEICTEITNLMDYPVTLRLVSNTNPEAGSTIHIHIFDGVRWNSLETGNLFLLGSPIKTIFSPRETKEFCSAIINNTKGLNGIAFIEYRLYHLTSSGTELQRKEVVLPITTLKKEDGSNVESIYWKVDKAPEFPGGDEALNAFFKSNIKNPNGRKICGIVKVVVEKDGTIRYPCVINRSIGGFDRVILPIILQMPKWTPAYVKGEPVRAFYNIQVDF
ncbi:energy transducer TonB [Bacteroides bouchesdurhonensis]|uniref:energy transducer TonB n=1 Tax=Bacteroides bouchesdurhonensis TaxID=1841855 RepID=UPI0011DD125F|nr:hypothetical protein [Bacteroides bouchesdurhonensis]